MQQGINGYSNFNPSGQPGMPPMGQPGMPPLGPPGMPQMNQPATHSLGQQQPGMFPPTSHPGMVPNQQGMQQQFQGMGGFPSGQPPQQKFDPNMVHNDVQVCNCTNLQYQEFGGPKPGVG
jgi:hypothetical protein